MINISLKELSSLLNTSGPRVNSDQIALLRDVEWERISNDEIEFLIDIVLRLTAEAIIIGNSDNNQDKMKYTLKYIENKLRFSDLLFENEEFSYYFNKFAQYVRLI